MRKKLFLAAIAVFGCVQLNAQSVKIKGIGHNNRYDSGDQMKTEYLGWNSELQKAIFIVDNGIYAMNWNSPTLSTPEKEPAVVASEIKGDNAKEIWANNFNMMYGNSGALYIDGQLITVASRDEQSTVDEELFAVRKWNAKTGDLLSSEIRPKSDCLESAGMSYNPKDGKVYGLFYLTGRDLPAEITEDPDYFEDQDADMTDGDAGYAICTLDPKTMKVTPITPGLYYYNFVTFAINSEGRAFALTSGGSSAPESETDGKQRDVNGNLTGAQLWEFDLKTGLLKTAAVQKTDPTTGETYTDYEPLVGATGYSSQYSRQAACFSKSNPGKMYWVGYYNSGKGFNEWGSWSSLSDREWRTNHKYDTCLYEVDINSGEANRAALIDNRWIFSALWIDGDDCSDEAGIDITKPDEPISAHIILATADNGGIWQQVELGKQYTYFFEPAIGWKVHSVTFNNEDVTSELTDKGTYTTPEITRQESTLFVVFEQNVTEVQTVRGTDPQVKVLGINGGIRVEGANPGDQLQVYSVDGRLIESMTLNGRQTDVSLDGKSLYIIKVANKVLKVRL